MDSIDSAYESQPPAQGASEERDRSFLTVNTGEMMRLEVTPHLVDALHCVRANLADDVSPDMGQEARKAADCIGIGRI